MQGRDLGSSAYAAVRTLLLVIVLGGLAFGLIWLAAHLNDAGLIPRLLGLVGVYLLGGGVLLVTLLLAVAALGRNRATKLFFVRNKVFTPEVAHDLAAKEAAAATIPIESGQGVLRFMPVKPGWWSDDAYPADVTPVVSVNGVEHRLSGWEPYDIAAPASTVEVAAWLPRRSGTAGRRVHNFLSVPEGRVTAVVYRPSSLPELAGTVELLQIEAAGTLSMLRLGLAAALLVGVAYVVIAV